MARARRESTTRSSAELAEHIHAIGILRGDSSAADPDDEGRFVFDGVGRGTVNLVIRLQDEPGARPVITPGIEI